MTRIERFGRLLELVIPGKEEPLPESPQKPCLSCAKESACYQPGTQNAATFYECGKYQEYHSSYLGLFDSYYHLNENWMILAIRRFHVLHYRSPDFAGIYIPKNPDTSTIINLFRIDFQDNDKWKKQTDPIVPMLYDKSGATWNAIKVMLVLSGIGIK